MTTRSEQSKNPKPATGDRAEAQVTGCCGSTGTEQSKTPAAAKGDLLPDNPEGIVETVRERYGDIAKGEVSGCCSSSSTDISMEMGYGEEDLAAMPDGANLGLGCGAPVAHLELKPGEVVLDLGSGGGIDVFVAAGKVGPTGKVIGVDMTPEMIEKATANAAQAGIDHVEFRHGRLEELPVEDASVDAVTSNCVINLVPDKGAVFREVARALKVGGRLAISDVILDGKLPEAVERDVLAHGGCVSGAMQRETYFGMLRDAGLGDIEIVKDVDFIASVADSLPKEINAAMEKLGLNSDDLKGVVRSVTYRARKVT